MNVTLDTEVALDAFRITADSLLSLRIRPAPRVTVCPFSTLFRSPIPCLGHNVEVPRAGSRAGEVALDHGHRGGADEHPAEVEWRGQGQRRIVVVSNVLGESAAGERYDQLQVTLGTEVALDECRMT